MILKKRAARGKKGCYKGPLGALRKNDGRWRPRGRPS
jgi:hypothetical protein